MTKLTVWRIIERQLRTQAVVAWPVNPNIIQHENYVE
jgi:hypothetical protein